MSSVDKASRGNRSTGSASRSDSANSTSSHGTSGSKSANRAVHGQSTSPTQSTTKSTPPKKTGHTDQDSFENPTIQSTVSRLDPENHWLAKKDQTFCNQFASAYAKEMGDNTINSGQTANEQIQALANSPDYRVASDEEAKQAAADGKLAFATWSNPKEGGHGHIAAVVGEKDHVPAIAQAGTKNYNFAKVTAGFGPQHPPTYYVHK